MPWWSKLPYHACGLRGVGARNTSLWDNINSAPAVTEGRVPMVSIRAVWITTASLTAFAQTPPGEVTFTKDIAPILQKGCQSCHRPESIAPMPLISYEDVRPWAKAMKVRT